MVTSSLTGLIIVCGLQKVVLKDSINKVFNIEDISDPESLQYDLKDIWEIDASNLLQSQEDCPIVSYKLCEDAQCITESSDIWFKFSGSTLTIDRTNGIPPV